LHEGEIVGAIHCLEIIEDREFRRRQRVDPATQVGETVRKQVVVGALDEAALFLIAARGAKALDGDAVAADPSESEGVIKRV
jgi:hypothetical protein